MSDVYGWTLVMKIYISSRIIFKSRPWLKKKPFPNSILKDFVQTLHVALQPLWVSFLSTANQSVGASVSTLVLGVGLVEALRVDEADSPQAQCVLLGQQVGLAVSQLLVGHQGVVAIAHSHVRLQVGQLLGHLRLLPLQELWTQTTGKERGQRRWDRREVEGGVFFYLCFDLLLTLLR